MPTKLWLPLLRINKRHMNHALTKEYKQCDECERKTISGFYFSKHQPYAEGEFLSISVSTLASTQPCGENKMLQRMTNVCVITDPGDVTQTRLLSGPAGYTILIDHLS